VLVTILIVKTGQEGEVLCHPPCLGYHVDVAAAHQRYELGGIDVHLSGGGMGCDRILEGIRDLGKVHALVRGNDDPSLRGTVLRTGSGGEDKRCKDHGGEK